MSTMSTMSPDGGPPTVDVPSPHWRPRTRAVDRLVVHAMAEWVLDDGLAYHCTDYLRRVELSTHAFCLPDGRLVRAVDPEVAAFHAGPHNDRSVGIEVVVAGVHDLDGLVRRMDDLAEAPYTEAQYAAAGWWLRRQADRWGLGFGHVTTHAALDPARKRDPGRAFDIDRLRAAFESAGTGRA